MRTPLQGGLPPPGAVAGPVVEIACDESGFSGTNLLDPSTPMITHASVDLSSGAARQLIAELRSSSHELKSGPFLRGPRAREALELFLGALRGRALVHLIDKQFFVVTRVIDLLLAEPSYAAGTRLTQDRRPAAVALHRALRDAGQDGNTFLASFTDLVRAKRRGPANQAVERFLRARDALAGDRAQETPPGDRARKTPAGLDGITAQRVRDLLTRLEDDDRTIPPPLEPLLPALAETVLFWSAGRRRVLVTHDEQSALTADRLTRLQRALAVGGVSPLAGLIMVDSRDDPRVQLADLLAGVARRSPRSDGLEPLISRTSLLPDLW
uniref:hypothetical protein n=1 Tax=Paractinoplanes polyasparticus TaxID=2856853 RepID=UPI001C859B91|nr:hypothetical protein [Actinoplanes polyasparticus]